MEASVENIKKGIEDLNFFNSTKEDGKGTTRILFTKEEIKARDYIKGLMIQYNLKVEEDAIGNIFGVLDGTCPKLSCVWSGSHIDTVYNAGKFDGMAGVIAAIEALRIIKESGEIHKRTLKAVVFTSEEPTRFGLCCLGSRAMAGRLTKGDLPHLIDYNGESLEKVLRDLKYDLDQFDKIQKVEGDVFASVELHIEQGAVLEKKGKKIGIVESICAPTNLEVTVKGVQEHAGSTPMPIRKDALVPAAEVIIELERVVKEKGGVNTVGTVGRVEVFPNAANAIPGEVKFTIDIRDSVMETKEIILADVLKLFNDIETKRGVSISYMINNHDTPRRCDQSINKVLEDVCCESSIPYHKMVSGAYHDSIFVSEFAPMSMIFVPSIGGLSHNPFEESNYEDIKVGTDILAKSLIRLANE